MESVHKAVLLHEVVDVLVNGVGGGNGFSPRMLVKGFSTVETATSVDFDGAPPAGGRSQTKTLRRGEEEENPCAPNEIRSMRSGQVPWYLDGTLGGCGHTLAMCKALEGKINVIGFDLDIVALERAKGLLEGKAKNVILANENFRNADKVLEKNSLKEVDMILLDLGISSDELEKSGRGFTFQKDEPLLMTLGDPARYPFTAKDIVNGWKEEDIANVIFGYSEDRYARRIAKRIVEYREKKQIETSMELAEIVKGATPRTFGKLRIHPATKTFQALRIAVNDELGALKEGLEKGYRSLAHGGRMAVISFHSLEDRIVKDFYKTKAKAEGAIISKKPIIAGVQEIAENPRSRSAKLRVIEKVRT